MTLSWGGVISQLGGVYAPPRGGVKISLVCACVYLCVCMFVFV